MAQLVEFAAIPNVKSDKYIMVINKIVGFLKNNPNLTYKQFREWLKDNELWNKVDTPVFLKIIDVKMEKKKPVKFGKFVDDFFKEDDQLEQKKLLYKRLFKLNPLLVKYVVDAIDVEQEGRLHSTHELHRMLESFVYPGKRITLPNFKAWIEWAESCSLIRLIGIRWGLGEVGKEFLKDIRAFDVEDFLEEEQEEEEEEIEEEEEAVEETSAVSEPAEPQPSREPEKEAEKEEAETITVIPDHEMAESKPATSSVTPRPAVQQKVVQPVQSRAVYKRQPLYVEKEVSVSFKPLKIPEFSIELTPENIDKNFELLMDWWESFDSRKIITFEDVGLSNDMFQMDQLRFLFVAGFVSLVMDLPDFYINFKEITSFLNYLNEIEFFDMYFEPDLSFEVALSHFDFSHTPGSSSLYTLLMKMIPLKKNILENQTIFVDIEKADTEEELKKVLFENLYSGAGVFHAPFWLMREFVRSGLLTGDVHRSFSTLPLYPGRLSAFRLGFTELPPQIATVDEAIKFSRSLSKRFNDETDFCEPLNHFLFSFRCESPCDRVNLCPMTCREKNFFNRIVRK